MRMDATTCLKSLLLAMQQYEVDRNTDSAAELVEQVAEVSSLKWEHLLSSGQPLPSECVRGLVQLTGNATTCPTVVAAILSLLAQLAFDDDRRKILDCNFDLTGNLASLVHRHSAAPADPLVLQSLQLLQKLTYNTRVSSSSSYIYKLVDFLVANIQSHADDIIPPCLCLMANLCRDNYAVQSYIKSLDGVKAFNRTLLNFLNHKNLTVVVFTLSVLVSLTLNEKIGEKLFDAHNIHQTFQLIFNLIANGDSDGALTRKYAVDLLVDLLLNPKMADYLTRYQHFSACASRVSEVLRLKDADSAAKVLELLLAMCGVSGLRPQLCRVFFKPATVLRRPEGKVEPGPALVRWLRSPVAGAEACWPKAMRLLRELLEEALGPDGAIEGARSFAEMVLPVLLDFVKGADADLRRHCDRVSHVNDVLLVMCGEAPTRALLSYHLGAHQCLSQVETLLAGCHGDGPSADEGLGQVCAEALLGTLELMSKLRQQVEDMETSFSRALQDQRIVTPLALALTSPHRKHVRSGMALLLEAATLPDFPSLVLAESVAANNAYRQRATGLSDKCVAALDASTHGGLQVQAQAKEPHVSDIIDLYEQKLASKESRLRDALEAKASASSQVARCHVQEARAEAEGRRLAGLLKEAERRREDLQAELSVQLEQVRLTRADMAELLRRNARQQLVSEDHQDLKAAYNTLLDRFNESERLLQELRTAHADLDQRHQALKDDRQALQTQHDKTAALLEDREKELSSVELRKRQLEEQLGDHLARLAMIHTLTVGDKHNQVQK